MTCNQALLYKSKIISFSLESSLVIKYLDFIVTVAVIVIVTYFCLR